MGTNGYRNGSADIADFREFTLRNSDELVTLGRHGASIVLQDRQFYPHTLGTIADACQKGGAILHVIDSGYRTPEEMRMASQHGAIIHTPYQERVKEITQSVEYRADEEMTLAEIRKRDMEIRGIRNGN